MRKNQVKVIKVEDHNIDIVPRLIIDAANDEKTSSIALSIDSCGGDFSKIAKINSEVVSVKKVISTEINSNISTVF